MVRVMKNHNFYYSSLVYGNFFKGVSLVFGEFEIWFVLYMKLKLSPLVTSLVGSLLQ